MDRYCRSEAVSAHLAGRLLKMGKISFTPDSMTNAQWTWSCLPYRLPPPNAAADDHPNGYGIDHGSHLTMESGTLRLHYSVRLA